VGDPADEGAPRWGRPTTRLRRGRWSAEVRGDEVADIRYDGVLLLRGVRPVVRDRDWNTVPVHVRERRPAADGTGLGTDLLFAAEGIALAGTLSVELADGPAAELVVSFEGAPLAPFERNRIGLVVLHPAVDAGLPVTVRHPDGSEESGRWPLPISPHQPFTEVAGFAWSRSGITAALTLSGDVFETEDQRNWTDASFKTYSTPLSRPFPVEVTPEDVCRQSVRLRATGRRTTPTAPPVEEVVVTDDVSGRLPAVSVGAALHPVTPLQPRETGYATVLVELSGPEHHWPELLAAAAAQGDALGAGLDVRIVTSDPAAVTRALATVPAGPVRRLGVFDAGSHVTTAPLWAALVEGARGRGPAVELVGGSRAHFTELNRLHHLVPDEVGAWTFSLTPAMHARELPHLIDSLATQRTVAQNAVLLAAGRPVHVGPVTLARRFNAVATSGPPDPALAAAAAVDELQGSPFTAAWTLASVAALSVPGVAGLCYFEAAGPRGLVAADGIATPTAVVLDRLAGLRDAELNACTSPPGTAALAFTRVDGAVGLALANLGPSRRTVPVRAHDGNRRQVDLPGWGVAWLSLR
jgi:hypothetical protein